MDLAKLTMDDLTRELKAARVQWYEGYDRAVAIAEEMSKRSGTHMFVNPSDAWPSSRALQERLAKRGDA